MIFGRNRDVMIQVNGQTFRTGKPILASGFWLLASFS